LLEALRPLGATQDIVHETIPSPRLRGYRNQARLVFRRMTRGGHPHVGLGMYLPGSHRVVHIPNCPIQPGILNAIGQTLTQLAEEMALSIYDEREGTGGLRYFAARCDKSRKHVLLTIIVAEDLGRPLRALAEAVRARHPEIVGVSLHVNPRHSNVLFAGEDAWTLGAERLEDSVGKFQIFVSPRSFLQVNHAQAEWIYSRLSERLRTPAASLTSESQEIVLDLYCGIGGIALHLAQPGRLVIGVEEAEEAIEDARRAAHVNDVDGLRFVKSRVEDFLRDPKAHGVDLQATPVRAVVLNPPRAGCKDGVMEALVAMAPERIAYVSCRPFSLVRDLEKLAGTYAIEESTPVDMIPLTTHVESLTILRRVSEAGAPGASGGVATG
jgi:23S rRNA (uracil1939-C5)-methyltransferase